jgi:hypothetical protein
LDREAERQQLIEAREARRDQLWRVENPIRAMDQNPPLATKLRGMLVEIDQCLADMDGNNA